MFTNKAKIDKEQIFFIILSYVMADSCIISPILFLDERKSKNNNQLHSNLFSLLHKMIFLMLRKSKTTTKSLGSEKRVNLL